MCGASITPHAISPILTLLKQKTRENVKSVKAFQQNNGALVLLSRQQRRLDYRSNRPKNTTDSVYKLFLFKQYMFDNTFIKRYFVVNNMHAANNVIHFVRNCPCGYCSCIYCNVRRNSPHEAEDGSNSIEAMTHGG